MPTLPLVLPFVLLLASPSPGPAPPDKLAAQSARAKDLMAAERYAEAIPLYRSLVQALPDNPGLRLNLGMALHLDGQDEAAIPHLEAAMRLNPRGLPAPLFLGAAQLRSGRPQEAVRPLQTVVKLDPAHVEARALLADAFLTLSDFVRAEPHLRRLTTLDPQGARAWSGLGNAYEALAAEAFDELASRQPEGAFVAALAARAARAGPGRDRLPALSRRPGARALASGPARGRGGDLSCARFWRLGGDRRATRARAPDPGLCDAHCRVRAGAGQAAGGSRGRR